MGLLLEATLLETTLGGLNGAWIWALLGVLIVCGCLVLLRRRRRARLGAFSGGGYSRTSLEETSLDSPQTEATRQEIERLEGGLRQFAREVEERLDSKLDRLELLVREADRVLKGLEAQSQTVTSDSKAELDGKGVGGANGNGTPENGAAGNVVSTKGIETQGTGNQGRASRRRDPLDAITSTERERVLTMNREGLAPEAIAEATALRRGEVDLILRLEEIAQRSTRTA
jgi:hypothetical protein